MIVIGLLVGLVVLIGLGVVGLGLLIVWGSLGNLGQRWVAFVGALRSRGWAETRGTVTRSVVAQRRYRRQVSYGAAVRYGYAVAGKSFVGERVDFVVQDATFDEAKATVERYPVGSSQRVYYEPAVPRWSTLARSTPAVFWASLGWPVVALIGLAVASVGVDIVMAAFESPPDLGELPSTREQVGGLLVGTGVLALAYSGIRALLERKTRRILQLLQQAKSVPTSEARAGELVAIFGRAGAGLASVDDAFGEESALYLHTDLGSPDGQLTRVSSFEVCDETGELSVDINDGESLLSSQQVPIEGRVERWLDQHELELGSSVSAHRRAAMKIEQIREGDRVLVVGRVLDAGDGLSLRGDEHDSLALLFADAPLPEVVAKLQERTRATLAWAAVGGLGLVIGLVAVLS